MFKAIIFCVGIKTYKKNKVWVGNELNTYILFLIFLSEGGSMRSLSGKVL
jgi:hypothetical protein